MSVPEYVRRRNSTMFVGRPPFGSLGCESGDRTIPSGWTPPMSPPPGMAYSEGPYSAYPRQCQREVQRQNSPEPSTMSPDLTWRSESAAALFSSPRIPPATVVSGGISPMVKSTDDDNKDSTRNCDTTKAISPKDAVKDGSSEELPEALIPPLHLNSSESEAELLTPEMEKSEIFWIDHQAHTSIFIRCPTCSTVLKWVIVDHADGNKDRCLPCQNECTCEGRKAPRGEFEDAGETFSVPRGAW